MGPEKQKKGARYDVVMTYSVGKQLPNRKQEAASASCSGILLLSRHQAQQFLPIYLIVCPTFFISH